ncbi:MAG: hypothetical protein FWD72_03925 [Eggerthellaceae bacterium]|nr:hypothetical protein [Eggerthellaceae bacterium]
MVIRRVIGCFAILALCGGVFLSEYILQVPGALPRIGLGVTTLLLVALFIIVNVIPNNDEGAPGKLRQLGRGVELLLEAVVCATVAIAAFLVIGLARLVDASPATWVLNSVVCALVLGAVYLNGALRICICSQQVAVLLKALLLSLWWAPVVNLVVFFAAYIPARNEYRFGLFKHRRNQARREERVCETRYPLLLVHGIFFRDWKLLNYWGRIPDELAANGATVYYGHQQSSASVENSARELAAQIMQIVGAVPQGAPFGVPQAIPQGVPQAVPQAAQPSVPFATQPTVPQTLPQAAPQLAPQAVPQGKVNIIAHSKGGLDARFAVSCLGMSRYVASVTTISTPHRGCRFARKALENVPDAIVSQVSKQYGRVFTLLGDKQPDFFGGVSELTDEFCADLNGRTPDASGVLYQSVGTRMRDARSAGAPLNLGFKIVQAIDGDNDGLVAVSSMPWGESFLMVDPPGKRGVSHADVIDQTRKDIKGFDVCELYVGIAQKLKERGL